jgi:hypothetical protein
MCKDEIKKKNKGKKEANPDDNMQSWDRQACFPLECFLFTRFCFRRFAPGCPIE